MKIYFSETFLDASKAGIKICGLSWLLDGSALAENMRVQGGKVLQLRAHMARLQEGAGALLMPQPNGDEILNACAKLLRLNRLTKGSLRLRYFREGSLLIHPLARLAYAKAPIRLLTSAVRHYGSESLQSRVKANSMLPNWLAAAETRAWAEDGLRLTPGGYVAEGVWSNLLIEKRGVLLTPPLHQGVLEGTTRAAMIKKWKAKGARVKEIPLTRYDLYTADRVWICSSLRGAVSVASVDGRQIGKNLI